MRNIMLHDARYGYGISLAMTGITEIPSATQPKQPANTRLGLSRFGHDVEQTRSAVRASEHGPGEGGFLFWTTAFVARYGNLGAGFRNRSFRNGGFVTSFSTEDAAGDAERAGCGLRLSGAEPAMRRRPEDTRAESLSRDAPVTGISALRGTRARPCGCSRKAGFPPFDNEILNPPQ